MVREIVFVNVVDGTANSWDRSRRYSLRRMLQVSWFNLRWYLSAMRLLALLPP